jgi:hypothetical protein
MRISRTVATGPALRRWGLVLGLIIVLAAIPVAVARWPVQAAGIDVGTLRARLVASGGQAFQGYAQSTGLLPLPVLPNLSQVTALVSGTTEMRTWYAGPDRWRVDVLGEGTERDLYQTPQAEFTWDYGDNQLTRIVGDQPVRLPRAADLTPPELVRRLLSIATGDRVEARPAKRVAGVDAAGLRLVPAGADTTVAHVDIWADPATGLPLQAEVTAKGGTRPVFVTRFLEIHFGAPGAAVLTPPAPRAGLGYTVTEAPDILSAINQRRPASLPAGLAGLPRRDSLGGLSAVAVYGSGLASVVVVALPGRFGGQAFQQIHTYGQEVTVSGDGEASLITTGLLSVLAVRTGNRVFLVAGLVGAPLMQRVAGSLAERGR